jgi:Cu/Ag efflux pump CusA
MRTWPKFMTVTTMMLGLLPIFWSSRPGSDLMKRIAAPMAGGMMSSFLTELLIYSALYMICRQRETVTAAATALSFSIISYRRVPVLLTKIRQVLDGNH